MIGDADRRQRNALVMLVDPVAIIVMRAGKADHLPRRHVLVAAIDRIGEKAGLRVLEDQLEEILAVGAVELERAVLETFDDLVFLIVGKLGKDLLPYLPRQAASSAARALRYCCAGVTGDCGPCCLVPFWNGPPCSGLRSGRRAGELAVDINGAAAILAARRQIVGRDQPVDKGFDGGGFLRREIFPAVRASPWSADRSRRASTADRL